MQSFHLERADFYRRLSAILSRLRFLLHVPRRETAGRRRGHAANRDRLIMGLLANLHHDAKLLMASRGIRAFAFSYLNVVFAIYLDRLGYSPVMMGIIFTVAYLSGAVLTALWGYLSDRYRPAKHSDAACGSDHRFQRYLFILAVSSLFWLAVIIANVGAGGSGGGGSGGGPSIPSRKPCWRRNAARKTAIRSSPSTRLSARLWAP